MQPRKPSWRLPLPFLLEVSLVLLLAIGQPGATAPSSEENAELGDKRVHQSVMSLSLTEFANLSGIDPTSLRSLVLSLCFSLSFFLFVLFF